MNRFLFESDLVLSYIIFRSEIHKAYILSKAIEEFANNYDKNSNHHISTEKEVSILTNIIDGVVNKKKIISELISDYLSKKFEIKIKKDYLNFLIDIAENYFEVNLLEKITVTS